MKLLVVGLMLFAAPAAAQRRVNVEFQPWAEVDLGGGAETRVTYGGRVRADGPVALGDRQNPPADVFAQLDITSLPGASAVPNLAEPDTWGRYARVTLGLEHEIGRMNVGDQRIYTTVQTRWSFMTALDKRHEPLKRYPRAYAVGIELGERAARARLFIGYGRHEAAGPRRYGQWIVEGQAPVMGTGGPVALYVGGSAFLSVGPQRAGLPQSRDGLELHVSADVSRLPARLIK